LSFDVERPSKKERARTDGVSGSKENEKNNIGENRKKKEGKTRKKKREEEPPPKSYHKGLQEERGESVNSLPS